MVAIHLKKQNNLKLFENVYENVREIFTFTFMFIRVRRIEKKVIFNTFCNCATVKHFTRKLHENPFNGSYTSQNVKLYCFSQNFVKIAFVRTTLNRKK